MFKAMEADDIMLRWGSNTIKGGTHGISVFNELAEKGSPGNEMEFREVWNIAEIKEYSF